MGRSVAFIPALNEIGTIAEVVTAAASVVDAVIVVDDGSTDGTGDAALAAGATVIRHPRNLGVGAAISSGLTRALELGADVMIQIDCDGQHDSQYVPHLLAKVRSGEADLVIGTRFELGFQMGLIRRLVLRCFAYPISARLGVKVSDPTSGFRAFSPLAASTLAPVFPVKYLSDTVEVLYLAAEHNLRVATVPVHMRERVAGKPSVGPLRSAAYALRMVSIIAGHTLRRRSRA
jgi:glycosyltransferase involved in cell wall biosynthesis